MQFQISCLVKLLEDDKFLVASLPSTWGDNSQCTNLEQLYSKYPYFLSYSSQRTHDSKG